MKQHISKKGPSFRKLTDAENMDEEIYHMQMIHKWSFKPGEHPRDIYRKEQAKKDKD